MKKAKYVHQAVPHTSPIDGAKIAFAVCFKNSDGAFRCNFTRFSSACGALVIPMHLVDNYRNYRYTAPISFSGSSISPKEW